MNFKILKEGNLIPVHSNRIYSARFIDQNTIISAGWDKMVLMWDIRTGIPESYLYGPMICGESLDFNDYTLLTGSWRSDEQLELWDIRKMKKMDNIEWIEVQEDDKSFVYTCQFQKNNSKRIIVGTAGTNQLRLYEKNAIWECVDYFNEFESGIYSVDFGNFGNADYCCLAGGNGICEIMKIE